MEWKQQSVDAGFDLRGLTLVATGIAWLLGIVLAAFVALPPFAPLVGALGALLSALVLWQDQRGRLVAFLLGCLLLGMWRYTIGLPGNDPVAISRFINAGLVEVRGSVTDEPALRGRLRVLNVTVNSVSRDGGNSWADAHGLVEVQMTGSSIEDPYGANYGDAVQVTGKLQSPTAQSPPGTFASIAFPRLRVVSGGGNPVIAFFYHLRASLADGIARSLPQPEAALLIAVLLGLRTVALKVLGQIFSVTGTAHLIATSGFKVTILAGLVMGVTRRLYAVRDEKERMFPRQRNRGWRVWLASGLVVASIGVYTVLSGAGPAALRAGIMGSILVLAPRFGRTYNIYTALSLAALTMSALDPFVLWDVGFQLSFLGTLGIVLLTPLFHRLLRPVERLPLGYFVGEMVAVTLAAQVATLPVFAISFGQISLIAPFANLLTVPLLGTMLLLGVLLCISCLLFAPLALLCGWIAYPVLWYVLRIVDWCASLPYAYIPVDNINGVFAWGYYAVLGLLTYCFLKRVRVQARPQQGHAPPPGLSRRASSALQGGAALLVVVAMGVAALTARTNGALTVIFFDLASPGKSAQGEAIFIRTPEGRTALIDGGLDAGALSQALDSRLPPWQRSLDSVVLTSPRADHIDGLLDIVDRYAIGMVFDAGMLHPGTTYALWRRRISERHLMYRQLSQGATIVLGAQVALQVLSPGASLHKGSNEIRDNGLVLRLIAPGLRILLLGTVAESKYALAQLLQTLDPRYLQAEVVQIEGAVNAPFPDELGSVLARAHPAWLVITPALPSAKQRKAVATVSAPEVPPSAGVRNWQMLQTAQVGGVEIDCTGNVWTLSTG